MEDLIFLGVASLTFSLLLTPLVRNGMRRLGILDHPDHRKVHPNAIPRVGGVAIFGACVLAQSCFLMLNSRVSPEFREALDLSARVAPAMLIVFATGLLDDLHGLVPWQKLTGQIAAALIVYLSGIQIRGLAGRSLGDSWSLPLTVLWLVACTNAVNLIDGMDGLAAGIGLFATSTTLFAGLLHNNMGLAIVSALLVGSLLGFLRYNFNPATIFLGDCGSLLIGFLLGCFAVIWSQKAVTFLGMTAPLIVLSIPLVDTSMTIARRFLRQQSIFTPDRGHIHHRLLDRGLPPRRVALLLYAVCALCAVASLLMASRTADVLVFILFCAMTWIAIRHLGYVEFGAAGHFLRDGVFQRMLNSQISLRTFEERLSKAPTLDRCWEIVWNWCRDLGFHRIEMSLAGRIFEWEDGVLPLNSWDLFVPLSGNDSIRLMRSFGGRAYDAILEDLTCMLWRTLRAKRSAFGQLAANCAAACVGPMCMEAAISPSAGSLKAAAVLSESKEA
jgi:UDP-GlcNAc:undecaprenyl-phosphate GlcNAc-1-phosphate transferase